MVGVRTVSDESLTEESDFVLWVFVTIDWRLYARARPETDEDVAMAQEWDLS